MLEFCMYVHWTIFYQCTHVRPTYLLWYYTYDNFQKSLTFVLLYVCSSVFMYVTWIPFYLVTPVRLTYLQSFNVYDNIQKNPTFVLLYVRQLDMYFFIVHRKGTPERLEFLYSYNVYGNLQKVPFSGFAFCCWNF